MSNDLSATVISTSHLKNPNSEFGIEVETKIEEGTAFAASHYGREAGEAYGTVQILGSQVCRTRLRSGRTSLGHQTEGETLRSASVNRATNNESRGSTLSGVDSLFFFKLKGRAIPDLG